MRTGAAKGHRGMFHEAVFYGSDEEFLAVVVPFLHGGLAARELTVVALGETTAELVRAAMPDTPNLSFVAGLDRHTRPASAIRSYGRCWPDTWLTTDGRHVVNDRYTDPAAWRLGPVLPQPALRPTLPVAWGDLWVPVQVPARLGVDPPVR